MKKWLALLLTFVVSVGIFAFAGISIVNSFDVNRITNKFEEARKTEEGAQSGPKVCSLNVSAQLGGSVDRSGGEYESGTKVTITAVADNGYVFDGWYTNRGKYISMEESYELVIEKDTVLQARFSEEKTDDEQVEELNSAFETLYTEYNEKSAELQKETVKGVISGNIDALDTQSVANTKIVDLYVNTLFKNIEEETNSAEAESNPEYMKEVSKTESAAYDSMMGIVNGVVNEKEEYNPEQNELTASVKNIIKSDVCKEVITESMKDEDIHTKTQSSGDKLNEEAKAKLENSIQTVYNSDATDAEDKEVLAKLAEMFNIPILK